MNRYFKILLATFLLTSCVISHAQDVEKTKLYRKLSKIEGISIKPLKRHHDSFSEAYEISFTQAVDHHNPDGATFTQRIFLGHAGFDRPMVMITSGYDANRLGYAEPTKILNANQIRVEHRYFGKSVPEPLDWEYLTIWQAASDHHAIVEALKNIYEEKWINTGVSKGGQTAIYHRAMYPKDVDVSIPYVAPINKSKVDPRIFDFLANVGTAEERQKVYEFQMACFEKRSELLELLKAQTKKSKWSFPMGLERAFDINLLEFPFGMWQYGAAKPMDLPGKDASAEELFKMLNQVSTFFFFTEQGIDRFLPHYYQAMTEAGYYGYDVKPFKKYMPNDDIITWDFALKPEMDSTFNPKTLEKIHHFLQTQSDQMLFIYGELDTWSATGVELNGKTDALKMVLKGGYHGSSILAFPEEEKNLIIKTLEQWLDMNIEL